MKCNQCAALNVVQSMFAATGRRRGGDEAATERRRGGDGAATGGDGAATGGDSAATGDTTKTTPLHPNCKNK